MRSFLVAALTACTAGMAHAGGGGHRAPVWMLVALAVVGTPLMHALSARRWRFGHVLAVMGLTQVSLHAAMSMNMPAGHEHGAHIHTVAGASSWTMLLTHVGTTLVLAAAVAYGERALHWTARRFVQFPRAVVPLTLPPRPMPAARLLRLRSALTRGPNASRAPPTAFVTTFPN